MSVDVERLMATLPLTTPAVVIARSADTALVAAGLRERREEWPGLSDADRQRLARRLSFQRHRCNRRGQLHRRSMRGTTMLQQAGCLAVIALSFALAGWHWARRQIGRWR